MSSEIITAIVLILSNAATAFLTNIFSRKKQSAETESIISQSYTTLVKDLQKQIEIMKEQIDELRKDNSAMGVKITDMSIKIKKLEIENTHLKKEK